MRSIRLLFPSLALVALAACSPSTGPTSGDAVTVSWGMNDRHTDDAGTTTAEVSLVVTKADGTKHPLPLGRYAGCGEESAPQDGPLLTLSCRSAGGGDEFQVRMDATNVLAIDHRPMPEGAFETLRTVALEDGVTIVPVAEARK
jgi:hypothetical protein